MTVAKNMDIVLFGVSGSGKSTVGRLLATALDVAFLEGDDYHSAENIAKMHAGTPLTDADRWPWLDALGHAIAAQTAPVVVACSALRCVYREALIRAAGRRLTFVQLSIDPVVLANRMRTREHFMPVSLLESQLATLEPLSSSETGREIVETGTPQQTADDIFSWLAKK